MEEKSFAMEMLNDYKKQNKRQFAVICILLAIITLFVGGLVYVVTNYDFSYENTEMSTSVGDNNYVGNDGTINAES